jgi:hypothetical protein
MKQMFSAFLLFLVLTVVGWSGAEEAQAQTLNQIRAQFTNKCLDVKDVSAQNGALVQQWDCWGGGNQKWRLEDVGGGYYQIHAQFTNKCLDVKDVSAQNGALVQQWDCWGGGNQKWRLEGVSP